MHELSVVENIVQTAEDFVQKNKIGNIKKVVVQVGTMTGVLPKYLKMYYPDVVENTLLAGSELEVEEISAECFCRNCGTTFEPTEKSEKCPECEEEDYEIIRGSELMIKEIGYE